MTSSNLWTSRLTALHAAALAVLTALWCSYVSLALHSALPPAPGRTVTRGQIITQGGVVLAGTAQRRRVYPSGTLASAAVGFTGLDGGLEGLEASQDAALRAGQDVRLTLDARVQALAEQALQAALRTHAAEYGSVVVLDTRSGRIEALASAPVADPAAPFQGSARWWRDRAAVTTFEPGSEMKALTVALAAERGLAQPDTRWPTPMARRVAGATIHDAVPHPPTLTTAGVLRYSSNVGISRIVDLLGPQALHDGLQAFGIGAGVPGLGLPAARGLLRAAGPQLTAVTSGFGQGVTTTTLEFAGAFNTLANGGLYCRPTLLSTQAPACHRVISEATSRTMRTLLCHVVRDGIPGQARLPGDQLAGKTGTAQVVVHGRYSPDVFVSTFSGFFPAAAPQYTISVMVRGARVRHQGSELAAPLVRDIAAGLASLRGEAPAAPPEALSRPVPFT